MPDWSGAGPSLSRQVVERHYAGKWWYNSDHCRIAKMFIARLGKAAVMERFMFTTGAIGHESTANGPRPDRRLWVAAIILLTAVLWSISLFLPTWETRGSVTGQWAAVSGLTPALLGWLGLLVLCPAWFANILLIVCAWRLLRKKSGLLLAPVAFALAASAYTLHGIPSDLEEAVIVQRMVGYYLWLGSFVAITLGYALLSPVLRQTASSWKFVALRVAVVTVVILSAIALLEMRFPVGVSPLEAALKNPNNPAALATALARHPPQAQKNAALRWALRQNLWKNRSAPAKQVVMLLSAGANPNQSYRGETLLMRALPPSGSDALVRLFVRAGANVNARDDQGRTVLQLAHAMGSDARSIKILIKAGAH